MSKDVQESRHCLHKLAVPFFHHELVKQALLLVLEDSSKEGSLLELLKQLNASGDISDSQISRVRLLLLLLVLFVQSQAES